MAVIGVFLLQFRRTVTSIKLSMQHITLLQEVSLCDSCVIQDAYCVLTPPTKFVHNYAYGKRPVHRASTQGSEKQGVMVEHPWTLTWILQYSRGEFSNLWIP